MTALTAGFGLLLITLSPCALAEHHQLFILTGQSNSLGTTNGGENDPTSGSDPADQHILFSWHNVVNSSTSIGHSGQTLTPASGSADFTTLQDQQGGHYAGSATHWGPEMEFARGLYRAGVRNFGVIKASRGGGGNTNWHKDSGGHMYQHILDTVSEAVASLPPTDSYEIAGLLYLQGESDNASEAAAAGTRLKELTDNLRADLAHAANLYTVAAGTTAAGGTSATNQAAIAASTSYIDFFANTDLSNQLAPDGLHLNKEGKTIVGRRFTQAFLNAGISGISRHYGKLVFIGDSITQGGNGNPSYRYQVFKNLANASVAKNATPGYLFTGSVSGAYKSNPGSTPDVNGQSFDNQHDGHWGWRAFWENGRIPLPAGRYNVNNLGQGTLANWTGQSTTFNTADQGVISYTASSYIPDTAVIKIGINDLSGGASASQVRDDIALIIDQLRAANTNIRIHLCQVLYSNNVAYSYVDALNALLPDLAATKNTASATSPVWIIDANNGFDPTSMTYDNTHPNTIGETYVGDRISGGLGVIELPLILSTPAAIAEKAGERLGCSRFEGSDIYNSGSFASNWVGTGLTPTPVAPNNLQLQHPGNQGYVLDGTNTGWSEINHQPWTFEAKIKFNKIDNGFIFWLGTGTHRILIEAHPDRTQDFGANSFNVSHNNHDGQYHTFKITHDPANNVYHLWRDGVLLTPVAGAAYDATASDNRLLMGDYTSGSFGNHFDVTFDYVEFCTGFKGNQIYNGTSYINDWSSVGSLTSNLVNTDDLQIVNTSSGGTWLEGTNTGWSDQNDAAWTFEMRAKFNAIANGFAFWLGTGSNLIRVEVYADRTQDYNNNTFNVSHNNQDGEFHTFRITHDPAAGVYHVFRDGERLTQIEGVPYDQSSSEQRLILGDTTGGSFGNAFDVTIDYINIDYNGVWIPVGTDTDGDGMSDLWEDTHFGNPTIAAPDKDEDNDGKSNLEEYQADTDPFDPDSVMKISAIEETDTENEFDITVVNTSSRRNYTLYASSDLGITDPWSPIVGPTAGADGSLVFTDSPTSSRFYRVLVNTP
ncbi:hypothetical protein HW115_03995 [Verrucomicrobiaceae bacterium N1E253]|uniref:Sialate O-acetylesterase domain-containing protein n=1 Tax=Oceaniferula marina TaxID=2748318 RepID=A0A851GHZ6_9BACT|nr:hypothetical protein [Oceaniferula marina]